LTTPSDLERVVYDDDAIQQVVYKDW
jgi:hypothetical protein